MMFLSVDNCIRQAKGYCRVQYKESSISAPDPFQLDTQAPTASTTAAGGQYPPTPTAVPCLLAYVTIPGGSEDGVTILNTLFSTIPYQNQWCGSSLGYTNKAIPMSVVCKFSLLHHIFSVKLELHARLKAIYINLTIYLILWGSAFFHFLNYGS